MIEKNKKSVLLIYGLSFFCIVFCAFVISVFSENGINSNNNRLLADTATCTEWKEGGTKWYSGETHHCLSSPPTDNTTLQYCKVGKMIPSSQPNALEECKKNGITSSSCHSEITYTRTCTSTKKCSVGQFIKSTDGNCYNCNPGYWSDGGSVKSCYKCPKGYACNNGKKTKCEGNTYSAGGVQVCVTCYNGTVTKDGDLNVGCDTSVKCDPGEYLDNFNVCQKCSAGYYCEGGQEKMKACSGTNEYSEAGAKECSKCEDGTVDANHTTCNASGSSYCFCKVDQSACVFKEAKDVDSVYSIKHTEATNSTACSNLVIKECCYLYNNRYVYGTVAKGKCDSASSSISKASCIAQNKCYCNSADISSNGTGCLWGKSGGNFTHQASLGQSACEAKNYTCNSDETLDANGKCVKKAGFESCEANQYKKTDGTCEKCPIPYRSSNAGTDSISKCYINVSEGNELIYNGDATSNTRKCAKGYYSDGGTVYYGQSLTCKKCPTGYTTTGEGAKECTECASNYYKTSDGKCKKKSGGGSSTSKDACYKNLSNNEYIYGNYSGQLGYSKAIDEEERCNKVLIKLVDDAGLDLQGGIITVTSSLNPSSPNSYTIGNKEIELLSPGTYTIKETAAPTNYQLDSYDIEITIDSIGVVSVKTLSGNVDLGTTNNTRNVTITWKNLKIATTTPSPDEEEDKCYIKSNDNDENDYCYGKKEDCASYTSVLDGRDNKSCKEDAACYTDSTGAYLNGKYANHEGYKYYASSCPKCYKNQNGELTWGSFEDVEGFTLQSDIAKDKCKTETNTSSSGNSKLIYIILIILIIIAIVAIALKGKSKNTKNQDEDNDDDSEPTDYNYNYRV